MMKLNAIKLNMFMSILIITFTIILVNSNHHVSGKSMADLPSSEQFNNELVSSNDSVDTSQTFLTKLITHIFEVLNLKHIVQDIKESRTTDGTCYSCKFGIALLQHLLEFGKGREELAALANTICVSLKIESPRVCKGVVTVFKDEFVTVVSKLALSPSEICGIILGDTCAHVYNPLYNWTLPLTPVPKPPLRATALGKNKSDNKVLRVLHLSDTHVDTQYATGGDALCGEPLCCRPAERNVPLAEQSGYWGDYRDCDVPLRTLDGMLKHISMFHKDIDYVIWTGDVPAHDVWNQTRNGQLKIIRTVASLLDRHLGHIPLLPALGNHESAPANSFPQPAIKGKSSISWLYNELEDIWSHWLPNDTHASIKKGAFYSTHVKPGLKLVSLNMNYCNNQNWWLLLNTTDPADELVWLINELQTSELLGEKVHIIGHIPPGSNDCFQIWSQNYYRIVNRYESTIVAQFFGHTHQDEFELFYEETPSNSTVNFDELRPTNVAYVGPSATTFGGVNPGYRIYVVDAGTFEVIDHETYFANLTEANLLGDRKPLTFELGYTAKSAYGLDSLSPSSWHGLAVDMVTDEKLFQQFYKYFFNSSDYIKFKSCTDQVCKGNILCRLVNAKAHDFTICQKFLKDLMP